jgi:hypothetical protein
MRVSFTSKRLQDLDVSLFHVPKSSAPLDPSDNFYYWNNSIVARVMLGIPFDKETVLFD